MNISLTPTLEKYIQEKVASGLYNSVSEVIREALRLLVAQDIVEKNRIEMFNQEIEKGLKDFDNGNIQEGKAAMRRLIGKYDI